jgi:serine acetyltransferase
MVAAAAVVSNPVPPGIVVAGNPARFVRHLVPQRSASREHAVAAR